MAGPITLFFIKFFQEEKHADQFIAGELYLNTLAYFKRIENEEDDGRIDSTEAIASWWQPDDILIKLNVPGIGGTKISRKDLAGPVSMSFDYHNYVHVFCLYAMHITGFKLLNDGKIDCSERDVDELRRQLRVDDRCFQFGKHAVVINAVPFITKLREILTSQGRKFKYKLVEYHDETVFHGTIPANEIPFRKQGRFSYQQEFRICVYPTVMVDSPITIRIGDISSICGKMESSKVNSLLVVNTGSV
jgi:hypothetical protein